MRHRADHDNHARIARSKSSTIKSRRVQTRLENNHATTELLRRGTRRPGCSCAACLHAAPPCVLLCQERGSNSTTPQLTARRERPRRGRRRRTHPLETDMPSRASRVPHLNRIREREPRTSPVDAREAPTCDAVGTFITGRTPWPGRHWVATSCLNTQSPIFQGTCRQRILSTLASGAESPTCPNPLYHLKPKPKPKIKHARNRNRKLDSALDSGTPPRCFSFWAR